MSDLRKNETSQAGSEALYQQLVLLSASACERWAVACVDGLLDVQLWPRDRGDYPDGMPYRVSIGIVELGVWRITLCAESNLPAGVSAQARKELVKAGIALNAAEVPLSTVDEAVQCGLFGEVLYPWTSLGDTR